MILIPQRLMKINVCQTDHLLLFQVAPSKEAVLRRPRTATQSAIMIRLSLPSGYTLLRLWDSWLLKKMAPGAPPLRLRRWASSVLHLGGSGAL